MNFSYSVDENLKILGDPKKLYVGDVLFSVNGQRTTRFHTLSQVIAVMDLHRTTVSRLGFELLYSF